jgi:arylsulfatase A-like enzyme
MIVLVFDGLRPDSINETDTPSLYRLRSEGVNYQNAHSVFPTVTRVNAAAIATGMYPTANGLVSNSMYVPEVDPVAPFSTADALQLLKMKDVSEGKLLFVRNLGERLQERGRRLAVVSSGSTGLSLLLNPQASQGVGALINGYFEAGKVVGYPADVNRAVLARFGTAPSQDPPHENLNPAVDWAERVLRDYVLPELKPDVLIDWMSEPDDTQHAKGVGSPEALLALRNCDRNLGLLLNKLQDLGLKDRTDLIMVSDHGFAEHTQGVNVKQNLINAGLKASMESNDVVLVPNAQSILVHVKNHDAVKIKRIVAYLQQQNWTDVIFTSEKRPAANKQTTLRDTQANPAGWVAGTFSLEFIHEANKERGPDILFTLAWTMTDSRYGVAGTSYANSSGKGAELTGDANGHGGLNPPAVHSTMILWGADFKRGITVNTPSSNVDVTPTVLELEAMKPKEALDGRVLSEALRVNGEARVNARTRVLTVNSGAGYRASTEISEIGRWHYINKAWRVH